MAAELFKNLQTPTTDNSNTQAELDKLKLAASDALAKKPAPTQAEIDVAKQAEIDKDKGANTGTAATPPVVKDAGIGDPSQTTQEPADGKKAPSPSGSSEADDDDAQAAADAEAEQEDDDTGSSENNTMPDELTMLKKRADLMGLKYSNNIGLETLKAKVQDALDGIKDEPKEEPKLDASTAQSDNASKPDETAMSSNTAPKTNALTGQKADRPLTVREHLIAEKMKLIRLRITNLDPKKGDLPGEILTVANEYLGTVRKYIPFGEVTDNGYHVPYVLYEMLKERKFLSIKTRKNPANGQLVVTHQWVPEFALDILDPLTPEELARLGAQQAANGATSDGL